MTKSPSKLDGLFPPDSPYNKRLVFKLQLDWHPWRLIQAQALAKLGFDRFIINGFGNTVAKATLNSHEMELRVSYVPDRQHIHIYQKGDSVPIVVSDSVGVDPDNDSWLQDIVDELVGELLMWRTEESTYENTTRR